jgi:hypothetical protein
MPKQDPMIRVAAIPAPGGKLTPKKWRQVERYLEQWKADVLDAVRKHPAKSFEAGRAQIEAFVNLLGKLGQVSVPPATVPRGADVAGGAVVGRALHVPRDRRRAERVHRQDQGRDPLRRQGAREPVTSPPRSTRRPGTARSTGARSPAPSPSARWPPAASARCEQMGYDRVWCPPHAGACKSCRRLIENKVFPIAQVKDATNYGRKQQDWIPCIPLHPHCRHVWLPYEPEVVEAAIEHYRKMEEAGFTDDDRLDEMFDSSGQLNPEYASTDFSMFKTRDELGDHIEQLYQGALADAVSKCRTSVLIGKVRKRFPEVASSSSAPTSTSASPTPPSSTRSPASTSSAAPSVQRADRVQARRRHHVPARRPAPRR